MEIDHAAFAYLPGALQAAKDGHIPGGLINNREFIGECAEFAAGVAQEFRDLLFDPQTSGGLLVAISADAAAEALRAMERYGLAGLHVGNAVSKRAPLLYVK
jgi:selenide,water dikinase